MDASRLEGATMSGELPCSVEQGSHNASLRNHGVKGRLGTGGAPRARGGGEGGGPALPPMRPGGFWVLVLEPADAGRRPKAAPAVIVVPCSRSSLACLLKWTTSSVQKVGNPPTNKRPNESIGEHEPSQSRCQPIERAAHFDNAIKLDRVNPRRVFSASPRARRAVAQRRPGTP